MFQNFNPVANSNAGCVYPVMGCMDPTATNYEAAAQQQPDGACLYPVKARFVLKIAGNMTGNATFARSFKRDLARKLTVSLSQIQARHPRCTVLEPSGVAAFNSSMLTLLVGYVLFQNLTMSYVHCAKVDACTSPAIGRRLAETAAPEEYVTVTDFQVRLSILDAPPSSCEYLLSMAAC